NRHGETAPAAALHLAHRLVDRTRELHGRRVGRARRTRDVGARLGERERGGAADAAAGTRDERDGAGELHARGHTTSRAPRGSAALVARRAPVLASRAVRLSGRVAIVTECGEWESYGVVWARALAREGASVVVADR